MAAVVIYFRADLWAIVARFVARRCATRASAQTRDFRFGLAVAVGSIPIAIVGARASRTQIEGAAAQPLGGRRRR